MSDRPFTLDVVPEGIPEQLRAFDYWLMWRHEGGSKPPYDPLTFDPDVRNDDDRNKSVSPTNLKIGCTFAQALEGMRKFDMDGVGLRIPPGYAGFDMDGAITDGVVADGAQEMVTDLRGYADFSPSGTGGKVLVYAPGLVLPNGGRKMDLPAPWPEHKGKNSKVQVFLGGGGYFTFTGRPMPGSVDTFEDRTRQAQDAVRFLTELRPPERVSVTVPATPPRGLVLTATPGRPDAYERARAFVAKCAPAVSGQDGHKKTFEVAREVVWCFGLGPERGFDLLWGDYNPRCNPPWSEAELRHKCKDAYEKPHDRPFGWRLTEDRKDYQGNGHADDGTPGEKAAAGTWEYKPIPFRDFMAGDYKPTWLVKRLLVAGQPGVIGGASKCMKTSIGFDLAVSLATGTPFLGVFDVYRPRRVVFISGESGEHAIRETLARVCAARNVSTEHGWPIGLQFDLPRLASPLDRAELAAGLRRDGVEVCFIDPLYLCLLSGLTQDVSASNVYQIGPLLLDVARTVLSVGCTPIILHHAKKDSGKEGRPLELTDLTMSGIAEFARQWLLLSRIELFEAGKPNRLWMNGGGSCGQSGLWEVTIDEGVLNDDFTGRIWDVAVATAGEVIKAKKDDAAERKRQQERERERHHERKFMEALDGLSKDGQAVSFSSVRDSAGLNTANATAAAFRLARQGTVEDAKAPAGQKGGRPGRYVRRVPEKGTQTEFGTVSDSFGQAPKTTLSETPGGGGEVSDRTTPPLGGLSVSETPTPPGASAQNTGGVSDKEEELSETRQQAPPSGPPKEKTQGPRPRKRKGADDVETV